MLFKSTELRYQPDPRLEHALDVLFILHADHEQNCSTSAVRSVGSSQVNPFSAVASGIAALSDRCTVAPTRRCCECCGGSVRPIRCPTSSRE